MPLIDIIVPLYNEEPCLQTLLSRLELLRSGAKGLEYSFILVDDGSTDRSAEILRAFAREKPHLKVIELSRNFGQQTALTAGLDHSRGDYAAIIDGDLQDPPELIPAMLDLARQGGFDVVYGRRRSRRGDPLFKRLSATCFYRLLGAVCEVDFPRDTGDFRLVSARVVETLRSMRERHRYLRGMIPWTGFKSAPFVYDRDLRCAGETKFPLAKMLRFASDAVVSFSTSPLRLATWCGGALLLAGLLMLAVCLALHLSGTAGVGGWGFVFSSVFAVGGLQILMLGIAGEYLGRIHEESKGRPLYVVRAKSNL